MPGDAGDRPPTPKEDACAGGGQVQVDDDELVRQYVDVVHRHPRYRMARAPATDRKTASAFPALNRISIWRLPGPMRGNSTVKQWI